MARREGRTASVTGRDGYITNKALLYAIAHIQSLPPELQEWSDMYDMCLLARARLGVHTFAQAIGVESHTGRPFTLWPEREEELTAGEREKRDEFTAQLDQFRSQAQRARAETTTRAMEARYEFVRPIGLGEFAANLASLTEREDITGATFSICEAPSGFVAIEHPDETGSFSCIQGAVDDIPVRIFVGPGKRAFIWEGARFLESGDTPTAPVDFIEEDEPESKAD